MVAVVHEIVAVFDLDDTLFSEIEYVRSGRLSIIRMMTELYGIKLDDILADARVPDFIGMICEEAGIPIECKLGLLWHYRLHSPVISAHPGVLETFAYLRSANIPICILTDGRSIAQRLKIQALAVNPDGIYISEEIGAQKPAANGYRKIRGDWPAHEYFYVGDNPKKDFVRANKLGWRTIGIRSNIKSVHQYDLARIPIDHHPHVWIENFTDFLVYIKCAVKAGAFDPNDAGQ